MNGNDILQIVDDDDLSKLRDLYKLYFPTTLYVYNLLNSVITWKKRQPENNCISVMAPFGNWESGTFILTHQFCCFELYIFSLNEHGDSLHDAITKTKLIKWKKRILVYAVLYNHSYVIRKALRNTYFSLSEEIPCTLWWMSMDKALKLQTNCPPNVYIDNLQISHADIINSYWPHKYFGSGKYLAAIIENLGGYGIFLKSNKSLIAWILRIKIGLGTLQVLDEYRRQGCGSLITKYAAKRMAQEGHTPVASTLNDNFASSAMLTKIGFEKSDPVMYFQSKENL